MTGIELYSTTAANNNSAVPNGFPEGMAPSGVNDAARQLMAAIRTWYETAEWIDLGYTPTYVSGTSFTLVGDKTSEFQVGRRVKLYGTTPFTLYATIATSAYVSDTTVTLTMDSGTLDSTLSRVWLSINSVTNKSISSNMIKGTTGSGSVVLATSPTLVTPTLGAATATSLTFGGSTLSTYATGTFTGVCTGAITGNTTIRYTKIGNIAIISLPTNRVAGASSASPIAISGLPAALTPATVSYESKVKVTDNGVDLATVGTASVNVDTVITIWPNIALGNFTSSANTTGYYGFNMSWSV